MKDNVKEKIACLIIEMIVQRYNDYYNFEMKEKFSAFQRAFIDSYSKLLNKDTNLRFLDVDSCSKIRLLNNIVDSAFFERTAQILCDGEKRKFKDLTINEDQQAVISEIISSLKNNKTKPNLEQENQQIFSAKGKRTLSIPNFDADVYYEDENDIVVIEIKTVKPNSGIFKVEKEKILLAKAALKNLFPKKNVFYYLAFPFDPLNEEKCGYDKNRFFNYSIDFKKFFDNDEVLLADEFWNFLSGEEETMQAILGIINSISKPDFMAKYNFINNSQNKILNPSSYEEILKSWFLKRELKIFYKYSSLLSASKNVKQVTKLLNQNLFDTEGKYKDERISLLLNLINF